MGWSGVGCWGIWNIIEDSETGLMASSTSTRSWAPATSLPQAPSRGKANTCQTASSYSVEEDVPVIVAPLWDYPWQTGGTRVKTTTVKLHGAGLSDGSGQPWNLDSGFIAQWNQDGDLTNVDEKVHLTPR